MLEIDEGTRASLPAVMLREGFLEVLVLDGV